MAYITDSDYTVQAHTEILKLLDNSEEKTALRFAEKMAIDQIKKRLGGRYDMNAVFGKTGDERDAFIIMITIDIAIFHLYSQKAPRLIPEYREKRYADALEWLNDVGDGRTPIDLPPLPDNTWRGEVRIFSIHKPNDNKF